MLYSTNHRTGTGLKNMHIHGMNFGMLQSDNSWEVNQGIGDDRSSSSTPSLLKPAPASCSGRPIVPINSLSVYPVLATCIHNYILHIKLSIDFINNKIFMFDTYDSYSYYSCLVRCEITTRPAVWCRLYLDKPHTHLTLLVTWSVLRHFRAGGFR